MTLDVDDRVIDRVSAQAGTVKDHFMNQVIVCWDAPDDGGNYVSSVPAADLTPEQKEDCSALAKEHATASTETPSKEHHMTNSTTHNVPNGYVQAEDDHDLYWGPEWRGDECKLHASWTPAAGYGIDVEGLETLTPLQARVVARYLVMMAETMESTPE